MPRDAYYYNSSFLRLYNILKGLAIMVSVLEIGLPGLLWRLSQCTWVLKEVFALETGHTRYCSISASDPLRQSHQSHQSRLRHGYCRKTPITNQPTLALAVCLFLFAFCFFLPFLPFAFFTFCLLLSISFISFHIIYLIVYHFNTDCPPAAWMDTTDKCSPGINAASSFATVEECKNYCTCYTPGCVSAVVRNDTGILQCYVITDKSYLANLMTCQSNVRQYIIVGWDFHREYNKLSQFLFLRLHFQSSHKSVFHFFFNTIFVSSQCHMYLYNP